MAELEAVKTVIYRNNQLAGLSVAKMEALLIKKKPYCLDELRLVNCSMP